MRVVTRYDGPRARAARPQLTAVQLHLPEAATAGVDLVLGALGETTGPAAQVPGPELVVRGSSADHQQQA